MKDPVTENFFPGKTNFPARRRFPTIFKLPAKS